MTDKEAKRLIEQFSRHEPYLTCHEQLQAGGLSLELRLESPKLADWLKRFVFPWFSEAVVPALPPASARVDLVYADDIAHQVAELMAELDPDHFVRVNPGRKLQLLDFGQGLFLLYDEREGVVYLVDRSHRHVRIAYSAPSRWPGRILTSAVVEVVVRYLENGGFTTYHAGAIASDGGVFLIVGDGGAGKTTLLSALTHAGALFVANERCLVRAADDGIHALGYPQMVFVGLGTAQQFPALDRLIMAPSLLAAPQRRFSRTTVRRTPREKQPALDDKLGLLPSEFGALLGGSAPQLGGEIVGIIEPAIDLQAEAVTLRPIGRSSLRKLVKRNSLKRGRDRHFPHWLDLGFPAAEPRKDQLDELAALPALRMTFCVENGGIRGTRDPLGLIRNGLSNPPGGD